jgi:hypothetical protein
MPRGSAPGERRGGRQKGTPNKISKDLKSAIKAAFDEVGGKDYLVKLAEEDPRAFCALLGKTVPLKISGDGEMPVKIAVTVDRPPEETREQWLARRGRELAANAVVGAAAGAANGRDRSS